MKKTHCVSIYADPSEQARLEFIKERFGVKTSSAALRTAIIRISDSEGFFVDKNAPVDTILITEGKKR